MRSKLIKLRGPAALPYVFMLIVLAGCVFLWLTAKVADKWHESEQRDIDLSLCPLCDQPVPR